MGEHQRLWRMQLFTLFPKSVLSDLTQGPPEKLEFGSRIADSRSQIGSLAVRLAADPGEHPERPPAPMQDPAVLTFEVPAPDASAAIETAEPLIDLVMDDLSFQLQMPLRVDSMTVTDVTPPLIVGEMRDFMQWTGYDQYKLARSTPMGEAQTVLIPGLRADYQTLDRRTQDALDWYIKAMHSPWDADKYIFLWIALEILRNEVAEKVLEPTRLRCGHDVAECPACGAETSQVRQAATTYQLLEGMGVGAETARAIWDMRQIVHGAKSFDRTKLARLGELLQILRAAVAALLKVMMGIPEDQPPFVGFGAPAVGVNMAVGGTRTIDPSDLVEGT